MLKCILVPGVQKSFAVPDFWGESKNPLLCPMPTRQFFRPLFLRKNRFFSAEKSIFSKIMKIITFDRKFGKFIGNLI